LDLESDWWEDQPIKMFKKFKIRHLAIPILLGGGIYVGSCVEKVPLFNRRHVMLFKDTQDFLTDITFGGTITRCVPKSTNVFYHDLILGSDLYGLCCQRDFEGLWRRGETH
jgi:hypothetical protein